MSQKGRTCGLFLLCEGLIRYSVGIEETEDLIADLEQALIV
jgi:cystathionine beta-lyase/cystathionine gamma-synthase